jgi:hypothetical protein
MVAWRSSEAGDGPHHGWRNVRHRNLSAVLTRVALQADQALRRVQTGIGRGRLNSA